MNNPLRKEVLQCFKQLHRTRQKIFNEDLVTSAAAREEINKGFKKSKNVEDSVAINELLTFGLNVEKELRTSVIQAQQIDSNVYRLNITKDTAKIDNKSYKDIVDPSIVSVCQNGKK